MSERNGFPIDVEELCHRLDAWPYLRVERRTDRAILRVRDVTVGTLHLSTHTLAVSVPPFRVSAVLQSYAKLRQTGDGVSLHVTDSDSRATAEALLRWRINLERFVPQLGVASP